MLLLLLDFPADRLQVVMVAARAGRHLLPVEFERARRAVLLVLGCGSGGRPDFIEHGHVMVLVLHSRPCFALFGELFLLVDAPRQRSHVFFGLARVGFSASDFRIVLALHMHHMGSGTFYFFAGSPPVAIA